MEAAVKQGAAPEAQEKKVLTLYQAEVSPLVEDADVECLVRTVAGIGDGSLITELVSHIREASMAIHAGRGSADILETLSATKRVVSTEKNHERGAIISVEIKSGKDNNKDLRLPEKILITIPVYRNDEEITAAFECELYSTTSDSGGIILQMYCYDYENVVQDAIDRLVQKIIADIPDVSAYSVKSV